MELDCDSSVMLNELSNVESSAHAVHSVGQIEIEYASSLGIHSCTSSIDVSKELRF